MKYFIGITPPEKIKKRITSFQRIFTSNKLPDIFEPHITVKTKNGLTEDCNWLDKVKLIIERHSRFRIIFDGIDTFKDKVVILKPRPSKELSGLHKDLFQAINPNEEDLSKEYFENDKYEAHFTLGMTSWGMTKEELAVMKEKGIEELSTMSGFEVSFVRIYRQTDLDKPYEKFLDIPLNGQ